MTTSIGSGKYNQPGKYKKLLQNVSKSESESLLSHCGGVIRADTRHNNMINILTLKPELQTNWQTRYVYFEIYERDGKKYRSATLDVDDTTAFEEERQTKGTKIDIIKIVADLQSVVEKPIASDEDDDDEIKPQNKTIFESFKSEHTDSDGLKNTVLSLVEKISKLEAKNENLTKTHQTPSHHQKLIALNPKQLKYDEDDGVGRFLTNIENVIRSHRITSDEDKIQIAMNCLTTSPKGPDLLGVVSEKHLRSWAEFKDRLYMMESSSKKSFNLKFKQYKRGPNQPCGQLMNKLQEFYLKSKGYDSNHVFSDIEIDIIKERFLDCLEPQLMHLLEDKISDSHYRNEDINQLDTLATRCMQLEENFRLGIHQAKNSVAINHIETRPDDYVAIINMMKQQAEGINDLKKKMAEMQVEPKTEPRFRRQPQNKYGNIDTKRLQGFCLSAIKNGKCMKPLCRYSHARPPPAVIEYVNSMLLH